MKAPDGRRSDVEGQAVSIEKASRPREYCLLALECLGIGLLPPIAMDGVQIQMSVVDDEPPPAGGPYLG